MKKITKKHWQKWQISTHCFVKLPDQDTQSAEKTTAPMEQFPQITRRAQNIQVFFNLKKMRTHRWCSKSALVGLENNLQQVMGLCISISQVWVKMEYCFSVVESTRLQLWRSKLLLDCERLLLTFYSSSVNSLSDVGPVNSEKVYLQEVVK